ncbi:MAG TPA: VTT domain-containing protein [Candidatus Contendobacter sp.]|nr:VTT domain-containing protein [Candidatus Contendobacter sp.]HRZ52942.1 VTT domain-containing protein [Candidatus Contendobacter sp.]
MQSEFVNALFAWVATHPGWMSFFIFASAAAESLTIVGVIIPGALVMFSLGALIGLGHLEFWSAYWWSALGAVVGDAISFWIGRVFHQGVRRVWPFTKHPEMITRSEEFFRKHGGKGVLFGRFFGPVRGTIPTVAGMMDMSWRNFMIANVVSAILWAPAYLVPGMAFGASLDIASRVAGRLVVLILVIAVVLWMTTWLVKHLVRLAQTHAADWAPRFYAWSQGRRFIGPITASLLDPEKGEARGLMALAAALLGGIVLLGLSLGAAGQQLPSGLDLSLYHFFQELRTPWADALMVFTAGLGDYPVTLPVSLVVFGWLLWRRNHPAAWHWLAALGFGMVTNLLFKGLLPVSSPAEVSQGVLGYSFPSSHATFSTLVFGFLAVLIAREIPLARRWIVYLAAALIIVPIAFARLYLGIHWLTDTLAGLCVGLIWVAALGLAYNHHTTQALDWRRLLAYSVIALLATDLLHVSVNYRQDLQRYQPQVAEQILSRAAWWERDWQRLPQQRLDFRGIRRQDFVLQWAATRQELEQRLQQAGWQLAPPVDLKSMLLWLSPQVALRELPVLPQTHEGSEDDLTLVRYGDDLGTRWLLRFWDVGARLQDGGPPIWVGSVSRQKLEPRMRLFTFAVDDPQTRAPADLLAPAWQGWQTRVVKGSNPNERITLIAD